MIDTVLVFLTEYSVSAGAAGGVIGVSVVTWAMVTKPFRWMFGRTETVKLGDETKAALAPIQTKDTTALTVTESQVRWTTPTPTTNAPLPCMKHPSTSNPTPT
ncbi:MAG: hypothetical protein OSA52_10500 [Yoonia sp.]|nr:hypothetical protein [Yoonia sp.]